MHILILHSISFRKKSLHNKFQGLKLPMSLDILTLLKLEQDAIPKRRLPVTQWFISHPRKTKTSKHNYPKFTFPRLKHSVFYVLLAMHLGVIFVNNQLDAQFFFMYVYFFLYMFRAAMWPSSEELILSVRHPVYVTLYGWVFIVKPAHQTVIYTEWHIPDVVLIQLILLMMGTWLSETCRE